MIPRIFVSTVTAIHSAHDQPSLDTGEQCRLPIHSMPTPMPTGSRSQSAAVDRPPRLYSGDGSRRGLSGYVRFLEMRLVGKLATRVRIPLAPHFPYQIGHLNRPHRKYRAEADSSRHRRCQRRCRSRRKGVCTRWSIGDAARPRDPRWVQDQRVLVRRATDPTTATAIHAAA
jgi:hypothetical protein